jgi:hypothetical protein
MTLKYRRLSSLGEAEIPGAAEGSDIIRIQSNGACVHIQNTWFAKKALRLLQRDLKGQTIKILSKSRQSFYMLSSP